jgi:UDP-N-acetylmuramoyl-L-alanyl-D-glutamate--2,6-diaminopimelate ligase
LIVDDVREHVGPIASQVYGDPSRRLALLGVTGTSGKTTTTFFVHAGLHASGRTSGLIGTVETRIGVDAVKTGFTTPEAPELQALLAVMHEQRASDVTMEVSSHALAMGRVGGCSFAVAAFTNLSEDHLDFHADMDDYFAAKARLFDGRANTEIVVVDDEWGRRLVRPTTITVSAAGREATWTARDVEADATGRLRFVVDGPVGELSAGCAVPGRYNVTNVLLALAILHEADVPAEVAVSAIATATVPGRMERVDAGQAFLAVVDYSHKPAAVAGALAALRPLTRGRLIIVLGCGGDRDRAKRPVMGEIAARQADLLIVTDDNPRSEDPAAIRGVVYPFDDRVVLRSALERTLS